MSNFASYPSLLNKTVFITGGATGIGSVLVEAFAKQGAHVAFIDIADEEGDTLVKTLAGQGYDKVHYAHCDVTNIDALQASVQDAADIFGNIDVLVNNASNDQRYDVEEVTAEKWRRSLAINLDPAFFTAQKVQKMMRESGGGSIINFSSINALFGPANMPSYITAKAALLGLTKSMATDFGDDNIRVNAIIPGWIVTPRQLEKWLTPEAEKEWMELVRLKKRIQPIDVANLALFLAADDSQMITSQNFVIDGGRL